MHVWNDREQGFFAERVGWRGRRVRGKIKRKGGERLVGDQKVVMEHMFEFIREVSK